MTSKYTVVQFSPNAITGECINIGVIAFDQESVRAKFLRAWNRVQRFAGYDYDVSFLKDFAQQVEESVAAQRRLAFGEGMPELNEQLILEIANKWTNSIQLTPPRTSLLPANELINNLATQFLTQPSRHERGYRDRRTAASLAKTFTKQALEDEVGKELVEKLLHPEREIRGRYGPHYFDAVVANGSPYMAMHGISFELPQAALLDQLVNSVAFEVYDVRLENANLPIAILALPPKRSSFGHIRRTYDRARKTYEGLKTEVITERGAEAWVREHIKHMPIK